MPGSVAADAADGKAAIPAGMEVAGQAAPIAPGVPMAAQVSKGAAPAAPATDLRRGEAETGQAGNAYVESKLNALGASAGPVRSQPKAGTQMAAADAMSAMAEMKQAQPQGPGATQGDSQMNPFSNDFMSQQLNALNGAIESLEAGTEALGNGSGGVSAIAGRSTQSAKTGQMGGASALSGGEFLNTLNGVKADLTGQQNGGQMGNGGGSSLGHPKSAAPNLRMIPGGQKGSQSFGQVLGESARPVSGKPRLMAGGLASEGDLTAAGAMASAVGQQHSVNNGAQVAAPVTVVTGHVTQNGMQQNRLSSEALQNVTTGIRNMNVSGGGEMRVRLRPENLGELHIRVVTNGSNVGLQIQASDEHAKKILEESIGSLKDGLAGANLTLGQVEFSVGQATAAHAGDNQSQSQQPQQQAFNSLMQDGRSGSQGEWNRNGEGEGLAERGTAQANRGAAAQAGVAGGAAANRARSAYAANGRLNVMA